MMDNCGDGGHRTPAGPQRLAGSVWETRQTAGQVPTAGVDAGRRRRQRRIHGRIVPNSVKGLSIPGIMPATCRAQLRYHSLL
jgi:hypothetical protein